MPVPSVENTDIDVSCCMLKNMNELLKSKKIQLH